MNRRHLLQILMWTGAGFPIRALASGHNPYCVYRDSGGKFLPQERILVMGADYPKHATQLSGEKPITVLAETQAQYSQALRDIRSGKSSIGSRLYPRDSIVVMDLTANPSPALGRLDRALGKTLIVHDIPRTPDQLSRIHGQSAKSSSLQRLEVIRKELNGKGATDLTMSPTPATKQVETLLSRSSENDLIILIGHRARVMDELGWDPALPQYMIKFHDGTGVNFAATASAKPTVWFLSCNTFDDVIGAAGTMKAPAFATTRALTYSDAAGLALRMKAAGGSVRKVVSEVQGRPILRPGRPNSTPPAPKDATHPAPQRAVEGYQLIVQLNDGAIASDSKTLIPA